MRCGCFTSVDVGLAECHQVVEVVVVTLFVKYAGIPFRDRALPIHPESTGEDRCSGSCAVANELIDVRHEIVRQPHGDLSGHTTKLPDWYWIWDAVRGFPEAPEAGTNFAQVLT